MSSAAFGRHVSWADDSSAAPPPGHRLAFRVAVITAMDSLIAKVLTPEWAYYAFSPRRVRIPYLSAVLAETRESFDALRLHMLDLISQARGWVAGGKATSMDAALLRNLVEANMDQEDGDVVGQRRLTDEEVLSNTFVGCLDVQIRRDIYLVAADVSSRWARLESPDFDILNENSTDCLVPETSAHSLSFAVALLALYPDVQRKVYEEVSRLWPEGAPSTEATAHTVRPPPSILFSQ